MKADYKKKRRKGATNGRGVKIMAKVTTKTERINEYQKKVFIYVDGTYFAEKIYDNVVDENDIVDYVSDCVDNGVIPNL